MSSPLSRASGKKVANAHFGGMVGLSGALRRTCRGFHRVIKPAGSPGPQNCLFYTTGGIESKDSIPSFFLHPFGHGPGTLGT